MENERMVAQKRLFDREYATEWRKERDWLAERGFQPTYVKRMPTGVERYKYRKTATLFENLAVFYQMEEAARDWNKIQKSIEDRGTPLKTGFEPSGEMDFMATINEAIASLDDGLEDDTI